MSNRTNARVDFDSLPVGSRDEKFTLTRRDICIVAECAVAKRDGGDTRCMADIVSELVDAASVGSVEVVETTRLHAARGKIRQLEAEIASLKRTAVPARKVPAISNERRLAIRMVIEHLTNELER
jgi:hypothetical protein